MEQLKFFYHFEAMFWFDEFIASKWLPANQHIQQYCIVLGRSACMPVPIFPSELFGRAIAARPAQADLREKSGLAYVRALFPRTIQ